MNTVSRPQFSGFFEVRLPETMAPQQQAQIYADVKDVIGLGGHSYAEGDDFAIGALQDTFQNNFYIAQQSTKKDADGINRMIRRDRFINEREKPVKQAISMVLKKHNINPAEALFYNLEPERARVLAKKGDIFGAPYDQRMYYDAFGAPLSNDNGESNVGYSPDLYGTSEHGGQVVEYGMLDHLEPRV